MEDSEYIYMLKGSPYYLATMPKAVLLDFTLQGIIFLTIVK